MIAPDIREDREKGRKEKKMMLLRCMGGWLDVTELGRHADRCGFHAVENYYSNRLKGQLSILGELIRITYYLSDKH